MLRPELEDNLKLTLTKKLLLALGSGLIFAFFAQVATRILIELPALYKVESQSDRKDVERALRAINQFAIDLGRAAADYGAWDDTYEFISLLPSDPLFEEYLASSVSPSFFSVNNIDGAMFISKRRGVTHNVVFNQVTEAVKPNATLELTSLDSLVFAQSKDPFYPSIINHGFSNSNQGPIVFAASKILNSEPPYKESRGRIIFWRYADEKFFQKIRSALDMDIEFQIVDNLNGAVDQQAIIKQLSNRSESLLPRDKNNLLYSVINNVDGQPFFFITQKADERTFDDSWLSKSFLVGFGTTSIILLIISLFFSRTVITKILLVRSVVKDVIVTGNFSKRLQLRGNDEFGQMSDEFNRLLAFLQLQEKELKVHSQRLEKLASLDALTGIPNRRSLDEAFDKYWKECGKTRTPLSVLMMDVDFFKEFNDFYGHQSGDQVLKSIAMVLQDNLHKATDFLGRYGGEEFCVILKGTLHNEAQTVGKHLCKAIASLRMLHEKSSCSSVVTISVGVATVIPDDLLHIAELFKAADEALYAAKEQGRNRVCSSDRLNQSSILITGEF
jgi:diguanylate cyclase (GGDEF)-like protein